MDTYDEIHARGVAHQDAGYRNTRIFWSVKRDIPPRIVIYDFDRCRFGQDWLNFSLEKRRFYELVDELESELEDDPLTDFLHAEGHERFKKFATSLLRPSELLSLNNSKIIWGEDCASTTSGQQDLAPAKAEESWPGLRQSDHQWTWRQEDQEIATAAEVGWETPTG